MRFLILTCLLFFSSGVLSAQTFGNPPIQNFRPYDFAGANQNWDLCESQAGELFIANNQGLLIFNGDQWSLYQQPNAGLMRAVHASDELIYTGGYRDFGFWKRDDTGSFIYTSLLYLLKTPLGFDDQIWDIVEVDGLIVFQSLSKLYLYNSNSEVLVEQSFGNHVITSVHQVDGSVFVNVENVGLHRFVNGKFVLVSGHSVFKEHRVVGLFKSELGLFVITRDIGIYQLNSQDGSIQLFKEPVSESWVFSAIFYQDNFYLGTVSEGLIILDEFGSPRKSFSVENGLLNNTILSMLISDDGDLWLGYDYGLGLINYDSKFYVEQSSMKGFGTVYAFDGSGDEFLVGTNEGLFYFNEVEGKFELVPNSSGQVWSIQNINDKIIIGHDKGTFVYQSKKIISLADVPGTWKVVDFNDEYLLQGNYYGLHVLRKSNNSFEYLGMVKGIDFSVRKFVVFNNQLWIDHPDHDNLLGYALNLNEATASLLYSIPKPSLEPHSNITLYNEKLVYHDSKGFYKLDLTAQNLVSDLALNTSFEPDQYVSGTMVVDEYGRLWSFDKRGLIRQSYTIFENETDHLIYPLSSLDRENLPGFETVYIDGESKFYVNGVDRFFVHKDKTYSINGQELFLNRLEIYNRDGDTDIRLSLNDYHSINYFFNNIRFYFSSPYFEKFGNQYLRYKLEPFNQDWMVADGSIVDFSNLSYGNYNLQVELYHDYRLVDKFEYAFEVSSPTYLSTPAIVSYIMLFIGVLFVISILNKFYYKNRQEKLMKDRLRVYELESLASSEKMAVLQNEKLKSEIALKNKEISSTALSVAKKNEALNKVRSQVDELEASSVKSKVLGIIDKNLSKDEDWEVMKTTMNSLDSNFLKHIRTKHPELTHNDIRFCGYIRMNLSSKEIAPLLNISLKSIEIKRYRLRKKLKLSPQTNLNDYILSL